MTSRPFGRCRWYCRLLGRLCALALLLEAARQAYEIRLWAIKDYGPVIHEFDPWFNYRATEYLATQGWNKFFTWFDHQSWYPLGRPVATTIYPGMQITAVALWQLLQHTWTLNEVCCYMPAWFGAAASVLGGLLAAECSGSLSAGVVGAFCMALVPAHLSRSVGGGFDNESVAISPLCCAFWLWCRSLRSRRSWPVAAGAGLAYGYMAACWGGYIFVLNMVGLHAAVLMLLGSRGNLYAAYSLFFVVGTFSAMQVPMVGWAPLRSTEQLGPLGVFLALQLLQAYKVLAARFGPQLPAVLAALGALAVLVVALLDPSGLFSPFSVRVRALFVKHTKTGNPLVDSVAEHQPGSPDAYWNYLGQLCYVAPLGLLVLVQQAATGTRRDAGIFLLLLAAVAYFFASKMKRLIILLALPGSALTGSFLGRAFDCAVAAIDPDQSKAPFSSPVRLAKVTALGSLALALRPRVEEFLDFCHDKARWSLSHPQIVTKARNGALIDDYRQAYVWLRENTPEDARIMAWWDYGYQIAGIANRTTLADGNTWNHEHIALLGLCLSSPIPEAHKIARHLADYVLVWAGGGGKDDVGKSKHMARIANSVYPGHCAEEDCDDYGVFPDGKPSQMMGQSLVYSLCRAKLEGQFFQEVYVSANRRVRIARVLEVSSGSRAWAGDPRNRRCDAGGWFCPGQYPPELLELFNNKTTAQEALEYQEAYEERCQRQQASKPAPNGPNLPEGSYLDSCRGCSLEPRPASAGRLVCSHCRLPGSPSMPSWLDLDECPLHVNNIQGRLECEPKPNEPDIPEGGYRQSCRGCSSAEGVLRCSHCATAGGRNRRSAFELRRCPEPGMLENQDGVLSCRGLIHSAEVPEGKYLASCQGCKVSAELVVCALCSKADGRQVEASSPPCEGELENQDGTLVCAGGLDGPYRRRAVGSAGSKRMSSAAVALNPPASSVAPLTRSPGARHQRSCTTLRAG
ncbi:unnamed protein product [Effrenium voratum]|uniref:dolichyl-diphosphooligosaccharide--protein glycotransferase n=1 Tax=Effrenium voratum TaxID=2562239 RepID=A0AA36IX61_9DINO|nr:unnamed protein product [Effrenium voratum]